ncbi:hypothetical protein GCM10009115_28560 [Sphingopyxis soli]|uniref:Uncharacterized protein n=1 Tax=Sphingopyxis soli TaxID=592051 RepID=A0ABN1MAK3_9SPHN
MGVDVDEAGGNDLAGRIDFLACGAKVPADRDDAVARHRDIRNERRAARSVDDGAAAYHQIMHPDSPVYLVSR